MSSYTKLFPNLPPLGDSGAQLSGMGHPGGICDLGIDILDSDDSGVDAVWPIFGQFVAHDITADRSSLDPALRPGEITNYRTPRADLESLYGAGPSGAPYLYERNEPSKLLLAPSGLDVPRNREGLALIGDARNDTHIFINQMHVAFARLHNRLVDRLRDAGVEEADIFDLARRSTVWHYQHIILREFLPRTIEPSLVSELLDTGPRFYEVNSDGPTIPLEFAQAAYRYGHSQIRQRYQVNARFGPVPLFPDLVGFGSVRAEHAVDWSLMIGPKAQKAKRIDVRLPRALIQLPVELSGVHPEHEYSSLAALDLARGGIDGLASGQAIAREMGVTPLDAQEIGLSAVGWRGETPLWLYVLREAEVLGAGDRLGPVGGRIVGEVLVGILDHDRDSFRMLEPDWQPTLAEDGATTLAEVLVPTAGRRRSASGARAHPATRRADARTSARADGARVVGASGRAHAESSRFATSPLVPSTLPSHGAIPMAPRRSSPID